MKKTFIALSLVASLVASNAMAMQPSTQETQQLKTALKTLGQQVKHTCVAANEAPCSSVFIQIGFPSKTRAQDFMNNLSKAGVGAKLLIGSAYRQDAYQQVGEKAEVSSAAVVFELPPTSRMIQSK